MAGIKEFDKYGFRDSDEHYSFKAAKRGLSKQVVEDISCDEGRASVDAKKTRLEGRSRPSRAKPTPTWGGDLSHLNFDDIHYYMKAADRQGKTWDDVPAEIKNTFDKLGIPEG